MKKFQKNKFSKPKSSTSGFAKAIAGVVCVAAGVTGGYFLGNNVPKSTTANVSQVETKQNDNSRVEELLRQKEALQSEIRQKESEIETANATILQNNQTIAGMSEEISTLEQDKIQLQSDISNKNSRIEELNSSIETLQSQISEIESQADIDAATILSLQSSIATLQEEKQSLESSNETNSARIEELNSSIETLQSQLETLQSQAESDSATITDLQSSISTLQSEKAALQSSVTNLTDQVSSLNAQITTLQGEKATLQSANDTLTSRVQSLESQKVGLQNQLNEKNNQLLTYQNALEEYRVVVFNFTTPVAKRFVSVFKYGEEPDTTDLESYIEELELDGYAFDGFNYGNRVYSDTDLDNLLYENQLLNLNVNMTQDNRTEAGQYYNGEFTSWEDLVSSDIIGVSNSTTIYGGSNRTELAGKLIIPNGITKINSQTFANCTNLTSVIMPNSVLNVDSGIFTNCQNLRRVQLSSNLTTISELMFSNCFELKEITIPANVTAIKQKAFTYCKKLKELSIPASVTQIGSSMCESCSELERVSIPGITNIQAKAFKNCIKLQHINMPKVKTLSNEAFSGCFQLTNIDLSNVTSIMGSALYGTSVAHIEIPNVTFIDSGALSNRSFDGGVWIPKSITYLGSSAFGASTSNGAFTIYLEMTQEEMQNSQYASSFNANFGGNYTTIKYGYTHNEYLEEEKLISRLGIDDMIIEEYGEENLYYDGNYVDGKVTDSFRKQFIQNYIIDNNLEYINIHYNDEEFEMFMDSDLVDDMSLWTLFDYFKDNNYRLLSHDNKLISFDQFSGIDLFEEPDDHETWYKHNSITDLRPLVFGVDTSGSIGYGIVTQYEQYYQHLLVDSDVYEVAPRIINGQVDYSYAYFDDIEQWCIDHGYRIINYYDDDGNTYTKAQLKSKINTTIETEWHLASQYYIIVVEPIGE